MKLQPDRIDGANAITAVLPGTVAVNGVPYPHSLLVPWTGEIQPWAPEGFEGLTEDDFERVIALGPELVIFGSGSRLRFPPAALLRRLMAQRIGVETMDTSAACRTYNVLVGENRKAVALLLVGKGI